MFIIIIFCRLTRGEMKGRFEFDLGQSLYEAGSEVGFELV